MSWEESSGRYQEMIYDVVGPEFRTFRDSEAEQEPNVQAARFYSLLKAANKPLWDGCVHSELSLAVKMLSIKSEGNQSQSSFDQWATLISELSPQPEAIPKDFY